MKHQNSYNRLRVTGDQLEKEYRIPTCYNVDSDAHAHIFCFSEPHIFFFIDVFKYKIQRVNLDTKKIEESPDSLAKHNQDTQHKITVMKCLSNDIRFIYIGYSSGRVDIFCSTTLQKLYSSEIRACSHSKVQIGEVQDIYFETDIMKNLSYLAVLHKPICSGNKVDDEKRNHEE